ncbi:MAG TPA: hypothetical protein VLS27_12325 [Gammaproteobacteria bacterium]|nr:hypothetical protein [Gammaproteobacteria bacterium]
MIDAGRFGRPLKIIFYSKNQEYTAAAEALAEGKSGLFSRANITRGAAAANSALDAVPARYFSATM